MAIRRAAPTSTGHNQHMEVLGTLGIAERVVAVQKVSMFSQLPVSDLERIAELSAERRYESGQVVFRFGDPDHFLIMVVTGGVTLSGGQGQKIETRGPGEYVGELALLRHLPRSMTATAGPDGMHGLTMNCQTLESIIEERPSIATALAKSLADKLASLEAVVTDDSGPRDG